MVYSVGIMKIEIIYKISETERHIYEFKVYSKKKRYHAGTMISYRNGVGDIWGDKWSKHFEKEMSKEIEACKNEFEYVAEDYDYEIIYYEPYNTICNKYNPCMLETKNGNTRYSGCYFGGDVPKRGERWGLVPSDEKINELIDKAIVKRYL